MTKNNKLVVMDYNTASIHLYDCSPNIEMDDERIAQLGFNLDECYWMYGKNIDVVKHKGLLL